MEHLERSGPVYEDCLSLKKTFLSKKSNSFSDFKDAWHERCFYSVHKYVCYKRQSLPGLLPGPEWEIMLLMLKI